MISASVLAAAIICAILLALSILPKELRRGRWALIALAFFLILTAAFGAMSQNSRENPAITLSAVKTKSGDVNLTAKAGGSSLRSNERMLLRIVAITIRIKDQDIGTIIDPSETLVRRSS